MSWKRTIEQASGSEPRWEDDIPRCSEVCKQHDGKRCRLLGLLRPESICEPAVAEMGYFLGYSKI